MCWEFYDIFGMGLEEPHFMYSYILPYTISTFRQRSPPPQNTVHPLPKSPQSSPQHSSNSSTDWDYQSSHHTSSVSPSYSSSSIFPTNPHIISNNETNPFPQGTNNLFHHLLGIRPTYTYTISHPCNRRDVAFVSISCFWVWCIFLAFKCLPWDIFSLLTLFVIFFMWGVVHSIFVVPVVIFSSTFLASSPSLPSYPLHPA